MDIFRFIKWWWNKHNSASKTFMSMIGWSMLIIPNMLLFGLNAFAIYFAGIILALVCYLSYIIYESIKCTWNEYQQERQYEAQKIVDRLNGKNFRK